jgi:hypothetical protein
MLKLAITIALACVSSAALAQTTCQTVGGTTFCNGPNGSNYTGQRVGSTDFWSGTTRVPDPDGFGTRSVPLNRTCQRVGSTTFCN